MKRFKLSLILILGLIFFAHCVSAQEEIHLNIEEPFLQIAIQDVLDTDEKKIPKIFFQDSFVPREEDDDYPALKAKTQKHELPTIVEADLSNSLLHDKLNFNFEKGPIKNLKFFGAYRGSISANFYDSNYFTKFDNNIIDIGFLGDFKEMPVDFKLIFNIPASANIDNYFKTLISDSFVTFKGIPHHEIVVGNSRTPIGIEGGLSSYVLPFLIRSQISRNFGSIRARGVKVIGNYDLVDYNLGIYSSDRFYTKFAPGVEFTGWINFKPFGKCDGKYGNLIVGGGLNAGHNEFNYTVGGAYIGYEYKKISLTFETAVADGYNGLAKSQNQAWGFYSTAAYKVTDKLQLLARYDQFNPHRADSNNTIKEYSTGLNYYLKGESLRLILNYVYCENPQGLNSNRILFATQIIL